ncbi:MAG: ABC transporter permease [Oscillospiraceae bacterium]|jgi:peptide/nickel transport system permease protein|nr:ABC transporter permease [Oscillospiraceae bacterium]
MFRYIIKRLLLVLPTLLGITIVVQLFIVITPGDPARMLAGNQVSEEEVEKLRQEMGLNDPFLVRYGNYMKDLFRGDFGTSYKTKGSVLKEMLQRFPYTLLLVFISMTLAVAIGIPLGIYAATHQYSWKDNAAIFSSLFCVSMPPFWLALMLVQFICVKLGLLPVAGIDNWLGWILPCVTTALAYAASIARQMRSNLLEVIRQDFVTTARAKGQTENKVLYKHALKNAVIPIIMTIGSIFGMAMGGSMISEVIFGIPGIGNYTLTALLSRDYPVIQTSVLFLSTLFCVILLLTDVAFAVVDPRIRAQYAGKKRKTEMKKLERTLEGGAAQ